MAKILATLMRQGIAATKPLKRGWIERDKNDDLCACDCAWACVFYALNIFMDGGQKMPFIDHLVGCDTRQLVPDPRTGQLEQLWLVIVNLNDGHWTRERIADWVETV